MHIDSEWPDLLTMYNGQSISYDLIGNPLSYRDGMTMSWQNGRQLASLQKGSRVVNYSYDVNGQRVKKTAGTDTVDFYYDDNGRLIKQEDDGGNIWFYYNPTGAAASMSYHGTHYYFLKNLQGDVVALVNMQGDIAARYVYDAWGDIVSVTDANGNAITDQNHVANQNPIRYRGYYYDTESGLYYLNSRYYDPVTGRFINADGYVSTGQDITGFNMFAYCGNNPVNRADSSGEFWFTALCVVAIITVCAVAFSGCSQQTSQPTSSGGSTKRKDLATAPNLNRSSASPGSYNCYGNALGKQIVANPSGYKPGDSTRKTFEAVKKDVGPNNIRELTSINDSINANEFKVAMKCGPTDYHFIRLTENGWYNKSGSTYSGLYVDQSVVTQDVWRGMAIINGEYYESEPLYTDETIYFAVKVGWDTQ